MGGGRSRGKRCHYVRLMILLSSVSVRRITLVLPTGGALKLPAKGRATKIAYTSGWYAFTLTNPHAARLARDTARMKQREAANTHLTEWEAAREAEIEEEELCGQREDVTSYLKGETVQRRDQFEDVLRQLDSAYDDIWV